MAGSYADVPGLRFAYDRDGSVGFTIQAASVSALTTGNLQSWNDETLAGFPTNIDNANNPTYYGIIFPELRDITGYFIALDKDALASVGNIETSTDTTDGQNGTWTSQGAAVFTYPIKPGYRSSIQTVSYSSVIAVRISGTASSGVRAWTIYALHLYGSVVVGQNPDRLRFWHPTLDQEVTGAFFDWGDISQGTTADFTFRIKNQSATLTAHTITISTDAPSDTTPTNVSQHTLSNGGSFASTTSITSLAPGAISSVLTLRRTTSSTSALAIWALRMLAVAASWT